MQKNVFLIASPLQLLNAREAKLFFNLNSENCILILFESDEERTCTQMKNSIVVEEWHSIQIFNYHRNKNKVVRIFKQKAQVKNIISYVQTAGYIFIGEYRNLIMRYFVSGLPHKEAVLLDDGNITVEVAKYYSGHIDHIMSGISPMRRFKRYVRARMLGLDVDETKIDNLGFFTVYNVEIPENNKVYRNTYTCLKSKSGKKPLTSTVFFLGSSVVELGIVDKSRYFDYMHKIIEYYSNQEVIYIPHRRENESKLNQLRKEFSFSLKRPELGIESELVLGDTLPMTIAAFQSSALTNIYVIFDDTLRLTSFYIKPRYIKSDQRTSIDIVYQDYTKNYKGAIQIVDLDV